MALAIESTERQAAYLEKTVTFDGRPREKLHSIYSLNILILQDAFHDMLLVHSNRARSRATPERLKKFETLEERRIEIVSSIIREAIETGDPSLPEGVNKCNLLSTLMFANLGTYAKQESDPNGQNLSKPLIQVSGARSLEAKTRATVLTLKSW